MTASADPFGIRAGAEFVLERARDVSISDQAVSHVAGEIAAHLGATDPNPSWHSVHLGKRVLDPAELANFVLVLDALNFSFWGHPRWRVHADGHVLDGYWALTAALSRALDEGYPITDASYLARITARDVAWILRGESVIPLFAARIQNLREAGQALLRDWDGSFLNCAHTAHGSAVQLLRQVISGFPSFVDVAFYRSRSIPFYKRAQILVSDLAAALAETSEPPLTDLDALTAFADYKVPQVLQHLGVLRYSTRLRDVLRRTEPLAPGSALEVEIRSGTIAAVARIAQTLRRSGHPISDYAVDWYLWDLGQDQPGEILPYHRTRTIAY